MSWAYSFGSNPRMPTLDKHVPSLQPNLFYSQSCPTCDLASTCALSKRRLKASERRFGSRPLLWLGCQPNHFELWLSHIIWHISFPASQTLDGFGWPLLRYSIFRTRAVEILGGCLLPGNRLRRPSLQPPWRPQGQPNRQGAGLGKLKWHMEQLFRVSQSRVRGCGEQREREGVLVPPLQSSI